MFCFSRSAAVCMFSLTCQSQFIICLCKNKQDAHEFIWQIFLFLLSWPLKRLLMMFVLKQNCRGTYINPCGTPLSASGGVNLIEHMNNQDYIKTSCTNQDYMPLICFLNCFGMRKDWLDYVQMCCGTICETHWRWGPDRGGWWAWGVHDEDTRLAFVVSLEQQMYWG